MPSSSRKFFVGGNWKCNGTLASVNTLVQGLSASPAPDNVDAVVAPMAIHAAAVQAKLHKSYAVSAQNCSRTGPGAFTGEVSAAQLVDAGIRWVILGHSERRALFGETSAVVGDKVAAALAVPGLSVIACVGETLAEREAGRTVEVVSEQLRACMAAVKEERDWARVVVAYEPVWAIGTGKVASPAQAQDVHAALRKLVASETAPRIAEGLRIIYGGSVKPGNCDTLAAEADIDGFLVGGASLKPDDFAAILRAGRIHAKL